MEETILKTETENTENDFKDGNGVVGTEKEEMVVKRVHVIKRGEGWGVLKEGASRVSRIYESKTEAVENAQKLKKNGYDLIIHKKDGSIQKWEKART